MERRLLNYKDLVRKGVCRSRMTLHRLRKDDSSFPMPVSIGGGIAWFEDEIDAWLEARPRIVKAVRHAPHCDRVAEVA